MKIQNVFIAGAGTMGVGILQVCAQAGYHVTITDIDKTMIKKAMDRFEWSLNKQEEKGKLRETKEDILSRTHSSEALTQAKDADFIIEAIHENIKAKQDLFKKLEKICSEKTIFGTNTSSIPITDIASTVKNPGRVVGIHFFNPVHRMKLVEVVRGLMTSNNTIKISKEFVSFLGKEPIVVNRDIAGFIVNRINGMAFLEALRLLERGIASVEDIDKAMRLGLGHPIGPFELMDLVGLDIVLNARMGIYNETREPSHFPPDILRRMVKAGHLGRKTKKGFYDYPE